MALANWPAHPPHTAPCSTSEYVFGFAASCANRVAPTSSSPTVSNDTICFIRVYLLFLAGSFCSHVEEFLLALAGEALGLVSVQTSFRPKTRKGERTRRRETILDAK